LLWVSGLGRSYQITLDIRQYSVIINQKQTHLTHKGKEMGFNRTFNGEEQARLKRLIEEGMQVTFEMETLREGLRDTVKAIAEEMDLKPGIINKAIKIAHKANFQDEFDKFSELETILETVGKTL